MQRTIQCPGCGQAVDVTRPADVHLAIERTHTQDRRPMVTITVGRVDVHTCQQCTDGTWR